MGVNVMDSTSTTHGVPNTVLTSVLLWQLQDMNFYCWIFNMVLANKVTPLVKLFQKPGSSWGVRWQVPPTKTVLQTLKESLKVCCSGKTLEVLVSHTHKIKTNKQTNKNFKSRHLKEKVFQKTPSFYDAILGIDNLQAKNSLLHIHQGPTFSF